MLAPPATQTPTKLRRRSSDDGDTLRLVQNRDRLLAVVRRARQRRFHRRPPAPSAPAAAARDRAEIGRRRRELPSTPRLRRRHPLPGGARLDRRVRYTARRQRRRPPSARRRRARSSFWQGLGQTSRRAARALCRRRCRARPPRARRLAADGADDGAALAAFLGATRAWSSWARRTRRRGPTSARSGGGE